MAKQLNTIEEIVNKNSLYIDGVKFTLDEKFFTCFSRKELTSILRHASYQDGDLISLSTDDGIFILSAGKEPAIFISYIPNGEEIILTKKIFLEYFQNIPSDKFRPSPYLKNKGARQCKQ